MPNLLCDCFLLCLGEGLARLLCFRARLFKSGQVKLYLSGQVGHHAVFLFALVLLSGGLTFKLFDAFVELIELLYQTRIVLLDRLVQFKKRLVVFLSPSLPLTPVLLTLAKFFRSFVPFSGKLLSTSALLSHIVDKFFYKLVFLQELLLKHIRLR